MIICSVQTCFVDCLIEQTHPEIRKRYDVDVSCHNISDYRSLFFCTQPLENHVCLFCSLPFIAPIHRHAVHRARGKRLNTKVSVAVERGSIQSFTLDKKIPVKMFYYEDSIVLVLDCVSAEGSWHQEYPRHDGAARLQGQILSVQHYGYPRCSEFPTIYPGLCSGRH